MSVVFVFQKWLILGMNNFRQFIEANNLQAYLSVITIQEYFGCERDKKKTHKIKQQEK